MPAKKYLAVFADGSLVAASERDVWSRTSEFGSRLRRAGGDVAYVRVGRYDVTISRAEVAVVRAYSDEDTAEAIAGRGVYDAGRFRKERIADLKRQIREVRDAFNRLAVRGRPHPMRGLVEYDAYLQSLAFKE